MKNIDYEKILNKHLLFVVRDILKVVEKNGIVGKSHFYISFLSNFPGLDIPEFLKNDDEVTIVLQHEFWDLSVSDNFFSVILCFDDTNEKLKIPFASITNFVDPSVKFGLQFKPNFDESIDPTTPPDRETQDNIVSLENFRKK